MALLSCTLISSTLISRVLAMLSCTIFQGIRNVFLANLFQGHWQSFSCTLISREMAIHFLHDFSRGVALAMLIFSYMYMYTCVYSPCMYTLSMQMAMLFRPFDKVHAVNFTGRKIHRHCHRARRSDIRKS